MSYPPGVPSRFRSVSRGINSGFLFGWTCVGIDIFLRFTADTNSFFSIKSRAEQEREREDREKKKYAVEQEHSRRGFDDELKALRAKASGDVLEQDLIDQAYSNLLARVQ